METDQPRRPDPAIVAAATPRGVAAEPARASSTMRSYRQARTALARAIEAAGGAANIRRLRNVSLRYRGVRHMINQSRLALPPWDREPTSGSVVVDVEGERMFAENYTSYPGIGRFGGAWALNGDQGTHWEPDRNHHGSEVIRHYSGRDADGPWALVPRWIPPLMLRDAWASNTNLRSLGNADPRLVGRTNLCSAGNASPRSLGSTTHDDEPMHALAWTQRDGATITLLFHASSGALSGYESIRDDAVYGDVTDRVEYADWREIGGVYFPSRRVEWFNDEIARELDLDYRTNTALADSQFALPEGYREPGPTAAGERLRQVADGVYLDTYAGGVMIVEFRDTLTVVECPDGFHAANSTITALRAAFPDKPVRYVVPSHTHGDHGGGVRAYLHAGATILTTPGQVEFFRRLAGVRRTISPDPYAAPEDGPLIEEFRGRRVIADDTQTMVLYDIGPNAHSEELTIVHLPRQGIVWQADVFFSPATGGGVNPAMPIGIDFARKLASLGIVDFTILLEGHHSRIATFEEFRRALALSGYHGS